MTEVESELLLCLIFHTLCFHLFYTFFPSLSYKAFPASFSTVTHLFLSLVPSFASVSTEFVETLFGLFLLVCLFGFVFYFLSR